MTSPAAIRPVVDEWKLIKRQDNLMKSVVLWPNHCNERLGLTSKRVLSSNRKMKVKICQFCQIRQNRQCLPKECQYRLIWRNWQKIAKIANFVKFAKIVNVHPRGVNTTGWTNLTKLAKDRQNRQFCQMSAGKQVGMFSLLGAWRNWQKDRQNCQFCQFRQNRQCSPKGCQYQWMN